MPLVFKDLRVPRVRLARRGQQVQPVLKVRLVPLAHRERRDFKALLVLPALLVPLVRWVHRVLKDQPERPGHKAPLAHRVPRALLGLQVLRL